MMRLVIQNGIKFWVAPLPTDTKRDVLHNETGPAVEYVRGSNEWYLYGIYYPFNEWCKELKLTDEQIVMYKLEHF